MAKLIFSQRERYTGFVPHALLFSRRSCAAVGRRGALLSRRKTSERPTSIKRQDRGIISYHRPSNMEQKAHGKEESLDKSSETLGNSAADRTGMELSSINVARFYENYFGHPPEDLEQMISSKPSDIPTIYLVGDSTLDNKYWIPFQNEAHPNAHWRTCFNSRQSNSGDDERETEPMVLKHDICYWLANLYRSEQYTPINCAVEQTTLRDRVYNKLFPQDELVRDNLKACDVLVVSVGGNDVALRPTLAIGLSVLASVYSNGKYGTSALRQLFQHDLQTYIESLMARQKPRLIVICMVYFPCETQDQQSWASPVLRVLGYNSSPHRLQNAMKSVFEDMVKLISINDECQVTFVPLFEALDCKNTAHYVARVEPSVQGGFQIASLLKRVIDDASH